MKISNDEYELPEAIADSATELAAIVGSTPNAIISAISKSKERSGRCCYVKVDLEREVVVCDNGLEFETISDAAKYVNSTASEVSHATKTGKTVKGHKWHRRVIDLCPE